MSTAITQRPPGAAVAPPEDSLAVTSGDPGAELAALTVQAGTAERHTARAVRDSEERLAEHEEAAQVQALHDDASSLRTEAWFDGGMTVAMQAAGGPQSTLGTWLSAGAKVGDGLFAADQQDHAADAKAHEAAAAHAENAVKDAGDAAADASELVRSGLQFFGTYVETRAQTMAAALHKA
ncbi:MAG TPA: hypothetical protein VKU41_30060 [Polyangiaceae bacterium]|nr:hypothetical protein [Polyangiaceae bacterium]